MITNQRVGCSVSKILTVILMLLCLLGIVFFGSLSITCPDTYTQLTPSNRYSQVLAPLESARYKDVVSLSEAHKLFFPVEYINQRYQLVLNWTATGSNGKYDSLRSRVSAYNFAIEHGYRGLQLTLTGMVYIYLVSLIAARRIYNGAWIKLSICGIFLCSLLTFPTVAESIRERFYFFRFWYVPFFWTLPLLVIAAALVVSKPIKSANDCNVKPNNYSNADIVLLIISPLLFVPNLARDLIPWLYRDYIFRSLVDADIGKYLFDTPAAFVTNLASDFIAEGYPDIAFFHLSFDADIWGNSFYTFGVLIFSVLVILSIRSLGTRKTVEIEAKGYKENAVHRVAIYPHIFITLIRIVTVIGIPLCIWIFYRP